MSGGLRQRQLEPWQEDFARELRKLDPRLPVIYACYIQDFDRDCTARQLREKLLLRGHRWLPQRRWLQRLLDQVLDAERTFMAKLAR